MGTDGVGRVVWRYMTGEPLAVGSNPVVEK